MLQVIKDNILIIALILLVIYIQFYNTGCIEGFEKDLLKNYTNGKFGNGKIKWFKLEKLNNYGYAPIIRNLGYNLSGEDSEIRYIDRGILDLVESIWNDNKIEYTKDDLIEYTKDDLKNITKADSIMYKFDYDRLIIKPIGKDRNNINIIMNNDQYVTFIKKSGLRIGDKFRSSDRNFKNALIEVYGEKKASNIINSIKRKGESSITTVVGAGVGSSSSMGAGVGTSSTMGKRDDFISTVYNYFVKYLEKKFEIMKLYLEKEFEIEIKIPEIKFSDIEREVGEISNDIAGIIKEKGVEQDIINIINMIEEKVTGENVPSGSIIAWYPDPRNNINDMYGVPRGWVVCDGRNGTPDLRDRFILGSTDSKDINETGGSETHTLTVDELPAHSHSLPTRNHDGSSGINNGPSTMRSSTLGDNTRMSGVVGSGEPHNNMPPYYRLVWIMKKYDGYYLE